MDCKIPLKKLKESAKLKNLIKQNASKDKILKHSQLFEKYSLIQHEQMIKYSQKKEAV